MEYSATNAAGLIHASSIEQYQTIEKLARIIIPEFYAPYIPHDHNVFFVEKFQTVEAIQQQVADGFEYYLLANKTGEQVGYLGIQMTNGKLLLSKLYILQENRGQQIGQMAMDWVHQKALDSRVTSVELVVNRQNHRTIRFYERNGFTITENLVHHFENGYIIEDYKMTKTYNPNPL